MSKYRTQTPKLRALKTRVARVLYADDERAVIRAVAEFLGLFYHSLMSKAHDPHNEFNARIVAVSTLLPPGYTPEELVKFKFNSQSRVWYPGPEFNTHMTARLQQMSAPGNLSNPVPPGPGAPVIPIAPLPLAANPDLTALLQRVAKLNLGLNYPETEDCGRLDVDQILMYLYNHVYNNRGEPGRLAQWIHDHIPPANQPEFIRCWKQATKQAKAAQIQWEEVDKPRGGGLPLIPEIKVARKKEDTITDSKILAIGVALDKAEELRSAAIVARAAAVKNPKLRSEFEAALDQFNIANTELLAAWEMKWRRKK